MDITTRLTRDMAELGQKLNKFHKFYYALKEACWIEIGLSPNHIMLKTYKEYRISEAEYKCWQKVKKLIDDFEMP